MAKKKPPLLSKDAYKLLDAFDQASQDLGVAKQSPDYAGDSPVAVTYRDAYRRLREYIFRLEQREKP